MSNAYFVGINRTLEFIGLSVQCLLGRNKSNFRGGGSFYGVYAGGSFRGRRGRHNGGHFTKSLRPNLTTTRVFLLGIKFIPIWKKMHIKKL